VPVQNCALTTATARFAWLRMAWTVPAPAGNDVCGGGRLVGRRLLVGGPALCTPRRRSLRGSMLLYSPLLWVNGRWRSCRYPSLSPLVCGTFLAAGWGGQAADGGAGGEQAGGGYSRARALPCGCRQLPALETRHDAVLPRWRTAAHRGACTQQHAPRLPCSCLQRVPLHLRAYAAVRCCSWAARRGRTFADKTLAAGFGMLLAGHACSRKRRALFSPLNADALAPGGEPFPSLSWRGR